MGKCQPVCKPGSVWLGVAQRGGHSSGTSVAERLTRPTRAALAGNGPPPLCGLAPGGVCHAASVTVRAVGSYPTLSPLPVARRHRRSAFCGTFPGVAPAGCYPAPCFRGARTFLPSGLSAGAGAAARPAGRPYVAATAAKGNRPRAAYESTAGRWHEKGARHNGQTPVEGGANRYSHKTMTKGITRRRQFSYVTSFTQDQHRTWGQPSSRKPKC